MFFFLLLLYVSFSFTVWSIHECGLRLCQPKVLHTVKPLTINIKTFLYVYWLIKLHCFTKLRTRPRSLYCFLLERHNASIIGEQGALNSLSLVRCNEFNRAVCASRPLYPLPVSIGSLSRPELAFPTAAPVSIDKKGEINTRTDTYPTMQIRFSRINEPFSATAISVLAQ